MRTIALLFASQTFIISWLIAFVEYCFQVPANRWGHGQFTASQLKIAQEVKAVAFGLVLAAVVVVSLR